MARHANRQTDIAFLTGVISDWRQSRNEHPVPNPVEVQKLREAIVNSGYTISMLRNDSYWTNSRIMRFLMGKLNTATKKIPQLIKWITTILTTITSYNFLLLIIYAFKFNLYSKLLCVFFRYSFNYLLRIWAILTINGCLLIYQTCAGVSIVRNFHVPRTKKELKTWFFAFFWKNPKVPTLDFLLKFQQNRVL